MAATVMTLAPTLPGLYLAWKAFEADQLRSVEYVPLTQIADDLAADVRRQWEVESGLRRLDEPHLLPVSWQAADARLVEKWSYLEMTADGWQKGSHDDRAGWASGPAELAGTGKDREIIEV